MQPKYNSKLIYLANSLDEIGNKHAANYIDSLLKQANMDFGFDQPILEASPGKDGESMVIDWFNIPEDQRGRGQGRRTYESWEKKLPSNIKRVFLYAADLGAGPSYGFWTSLGFKPVDTKNLDMDMAYLVKER